MELILLPAYIVVFLYGIVIGSFLNVCIYRIPKKENIVRIHSHCMNCNHRLRWYELIPLFSYLLQGGRCRSCKCRLSPQYPIIEAANGLLYLLIVLVKGWSWDSLIFCFLVSALLTLSLIDWRTYEIPLGINIFILALGFAGTALHYREWADHVIGFFAVSSFIELIIIATKGKGMGGGDCKLMAAAGLVLGWKLIVLAFIIGCVVGSICHIIRMKVSAADRVLALGPYLSIGIFVAMLYGNEMISWYLGLFA